MNVLAMVRKEFNVDERRTYPMSPSMGGAGTLYLGTKYPSSWAAIAAIAPAAFSMQVNAASMLTPIKDSMPAIVTQGDADTTVPVANTQALTRPLRASVYNRAHGQPHRTTFVPNPAQCGSCFDCGHRAGWPRRGASEVVRAVALGAGAPQPGRLDGRTPR